ncbi:MAG: MFS transporter [Candidatus Hodarchaeota archaeon]
MTDIIRLTEETREPGRFLLPSLVISYFATMPPGILVSLLLIEIGHTFDRSVGATGQIQTISAFVGAITAVFMGVWSVRFPHRSLLLLGLLGISLSSVGCFLSLNFTMMLITFSISGLGLAMVEPMVFTLVGENFQLKQRGRAIGWLMTTAALAYLISAPFIGFIASLKFDGWRWAFLGFVLPIPLLSFVIAAKGVPSPTQSPTTMKNQGMYWEGYKEVIFNRSATSCLVGSVLRVAGFQAILLYGVAFLRERFLITIRFASIIIIVGALCFIIGSQVSGHVINRLGMKPVTILTAIGAGIFTITQMNVPNFGLAVTFRFLAGMSFGLLATVANSLSLEQIPSFRGTMMSLNSASTWMGSALGASVGGLALNFFDYNGVGIALGTMVIAAAIIYYLLVSDPTRIKSNDSKSYTQKI